MSAKTKNTIKIVPSIAFSPFGNSAAYVKRPTLVGGLSLFQTFTSGAAVASGHYAQLSA
jgi:hypothetical protein